MATTPKTTPRSTLSLAQLESHLWGAADILRGSMDRVDYKGCGHEVWGKGDRLGCDSYCCPPKSYGQLV